MAQATVLNLYHQHTRLRPMGAIVAVSLPRVRKTINAISHIKKLKRDLDLRVDMILAFFDDDCLGFRFWNHNAVLLDVPLQNDLPGSSAETAPTHALQTTAALRL